MVAVNFKGFDMKKFTYKFQKNIAYLTSENRRKVEFLILINIFITVTSF